jgi:hypothetical protein
MTRLDRLIADRVQQTTVLTVATTVDHAAEAIARDILADPAIRERLRALVLAAFEQTWAQLQQESE